jgi:uncharacterized protein
MIERALKSRIVSKNNKGKAIILLGPRQVGKTTLIKSILKEDPYLFLDCDDPTVRSLLEEPNTEKLKSIIGNHKLVFIDEAQRISNIGITLKLITDQFKDVQLYVSGSSALDLNSALAESLTGRKWEFQLLPISWNEFENHFGFLKSEQQLELRLLYGMYPDVINHPEDAYEVLKNLVNSFLFKDILAFGGVRKPEILEKLIKALALQMGSEVSYNELAQLLGIDKNTVANYIYLLEQSFVVFRLSGFSRNVRNEIKNNKKIYFFDNGVRNMVLGNFDELDLRQDKGVLWENFLISERMKKNLYEGSKAIPHFWRTTSQQEIDYVEVSGVNVNAFEFKWSPKKIGKLPKTFKDNYSGDFTVVNRDNFREFLM